MELHELVLEMKQLERHLTLYEEKYGLLSQDFYDPTVSESRIKRITQISRITPHIPTAASSFPSAVSFASVAIALSPRPRYSLRSL